MKKAKQNQRLNDEQSEAVETAVPSPEMQSPTGKIEVILKGDAPFDVLKHGEVRVGKKHPVLAPVSIKQHRKAEWLDVLISSSNS